MGRTTLTTAEIDLYSIRLCVQSGLNANGWGGAVPVKLASNGWPKADEIVPPVIYVAFSESTIAGYELGSNGKRRDVTLEIYAHNDPTRYSLAEEVTNMFRDGVVTPLAFVTGNEASPAANGVYAIDGVRWRLVPMPSTAADVDKWRARVQATIRRAE
jgi:hypothetical protein